MFDEVLERNFNNINIDYGIINGNNNIVLIKTGREGNIYGYKNKYLELAKYINSKYGSTIFVSSNPNSSININQLDDAYMLIEDYCSHYKYSEYQIYYIGISNGGLVGAWYGYKYSRIKRMLLINSPLMINYHNTKDGLKAFNNGKAILLYGSLDPSNKLVGLLDLINNDKIKYHIIDGGNHYLSNVDYKDLINYLYE